MNKRKKLGITGASGVLGQILQNKLKEHNIDFDIFKGDIRNKNEIMDYITTWRYFICSNSGCFKILNTLNLVMQI